MGKVIKNSLGKVFASNGDVLEVTAAIDSNIVAGNIKKDVEILGVTGTYEGSGSSGGTSLNFYPCSLSNGAKGSGSGSGPSGPGPEPGTQITFYCNYPSTGVAPVALIINDKNNALHLNGSYNNISTALVLNSGSVVNDGGSFVIAIVSLTNTLATLHFTAGYSGASFDPTILECAPIYAINHYE